MPLALCACGTSRSAAPSLLRPAPPGGFRTLSYPGLGIRLAAPRAWSVLRERAPLLGVITSATAVIALWRYPRNGIPPTGAALAATRRALIAAARARQPGLKVLASRLRAVGRYPAVELDVIERIGGLLRRVRSTHVFAPGEEIVLDQYAPVALFHAVDHAVFSPVRRSLVLAAR